VKEFDTNTNFLFLILEGENSCVVSVVRFFSDPRTGNRGTFHALKWPIGTDEAMD
jgi:hypothetical protein